MKKLIATCAILAAVSIASFAQDAKKTTSPAKTVTAKEQIADRRSKMYQKQYSLTAEQTKGVYQAELDYMKQDEQARVDGRQPGPGTVTQMNMERDRKFQNVMTADQFAKYQSTQSKTK